MNIDWIEPRPVGLERHDQERKMCFDLAREFLRINGQSDREDCVDRLIVQLRTCFASEDTVMLHMGLDSRDAHVSAHRQLLGRLKKLRGRIANDALDLMELAAFMQQWTTVHMRKADAAWEQYLRVNTTVASHLSQDEQFAATMRIERAPPSTGADDAGAPES